MLDLLFSVASASVLPAWVALAVAPTHRWTQRVAAWIVPAGLAGLYVALLIAGLGQPGDGGFGSLDGVAALFESRTSLLAGWVHYLAFDLVVGAWEARDAERIGLARGVLVPCLALTFLVGPAGWLLYAIARGIQTRRAAAA